MSGNYVARQLQTVKQTLNNGVQLVAVSKFHPAENIEQAYTAGQRIFGESRVQELQQKVEQLPRDIEWHFIGHLQTNKVKYIAPYITAVDAVDSERLLAEINRRAEENDRVIDVLLEVHLAAEETKYGFTPQACREFLDAGTWKAMTHIRIRGLMTMASNTTDEAQIAAEFDKAHALFHELREKHFANSPHFNIRSWGMSGDYLIAQNHGSNMVRIGTAIFGLRQ